MLTARFVAELIRLGVAGGRLPDRQIAVRAAYRAVLEREPDDGGLTLYLREMERGALTVSGLVRVLANSNEYRQKHGMPVAYSPHLDALHQARRVLIENHVPPAGV